MSVYRILIIEKENEEALGLSRIIRKMGYDIAGVAHSPSEAIDNFSKLKPDLIIMNFRLPNFMDGISVSEKMQHIHRAPILYITEDTDLDLPNNADISGVSGYISKPFKERDIRIALKIAFYKYENDCLIQENRSWLETVLRSIGEGIIATNVSGQICLINPSAKKILGHTSVKLGDDLSEYLTLFRYSDDTPVSIPLEAEGITQFSQFDTLLYIRQPGGDPVFVDGNIGPIRDLNKNIIGIVINIRDITEIIQTREGISKAYHQIEENLEKFALLNDQIRNPLSIIVAILDLDDSDLITKIMPYIYEIDEIINQLDNGYIVSSKVRTFLKKHHEIS